MITAFAPAGAADGHIDERTDLRSWRVGLDEIADVAVDLAADDSGGQPRTHLHLDVPRPPQVTAWPDEELVGRLLAVGVDSVRVALGDDAADHASTQVGMIAFLVHAQSLGLPVAWRLPASASGPLADVDLLHHLPPPDGDTARELAWRRRHDYGLCYWRHGLSFATVTDLRDAADAARFTLDEPAYVDLFTSLDAPRPVDGLSEPEHAVLADLLDARLALVAAGYVVRLPFRLRRWPMPLHHLR